MSCKLTRGNPIQCKDQIGGLKMIYILDTYCSNIESEAEIADLIMTDADFATWDIYGNTTTDKVAMFVYALRPNVSSMTVNFNGDPATGTTFFTQTCSITLQQLAPKISGSAEYNFANQIKLAMYNRSQVFVRDMQDNIWMLGMVNGVDVTGGTMVTGAAKGDLTGYTIEFTAEEKLPPILVNPTDGASEDGYPWDNLADYADIDFITTAPA